MSQAYCAVIRPGSSSHPSHPAPQTSPLLGPVKPSEQPQKDGGFWSSGRWGRWGPEVPLMPSHLTMARGRLSLSFCPSPPPRPAAPLFLPGAPFPQWKVPRGHDSTSPPLSSVCSSQALLLAWWGASASFGGGWGPGDPLIHQAPPAARGQDSAGCAWPLPFSLGSQLSVRPSLAAAMPQVSPTGPGNMGGFLCPESGALPRQPAQPLCSQRHWPVRSLTGFSES